MKIFEQDDAYIGESVHFQSYSDKATLAEHLALDVAAMLRAAINERGSASLVVSGGSTPKPFFEALKRQPLQWEKVYITLADERWVDADHADSNEKLVREHLLADGAHFISLKTPAATPHAGAAQAAESLRQMPQPLDVVILGMGDDGHTASLFPHAPELEEALTSEQLCIGLTPPDYAPHPRITLTLPALLNSRRVIVHITGGNKQEVYARACDAGPVEDMPIRAVLRQEQTPVEIYWSA